MGYIILITTLILLTYKINLKKDIVILVLTFSLISPIINIGSIELDSMYIFVAYFLILTIALKRNITINKIVLNYLGMIFILSLIYIIAWLLKSRIDLGTMAITILGLMKVPILLILIKVNSKGLSKDLITKKLMTFIRLGALVNAIAIIFQIVMPIQAYNFFVNLYSSSKSAYYLQTEWNHGGFYNGKYTRYFGVFESPMLMGAFCVLALSFLLGVYFSKDEQFKKKNLIPWMVILFISGMLSTTKTFILMCPLSAVLLIIFMTKTNGKSLRSILVLFWIGIVSLFVIMFYEQIYLYLNKISPTIAYRFQYLKNPLEALSTRFGDETGFLLPTIEVIKSNIFLGVGPSSSSGEFIGDNAYVVILHHGGLFALIVFMFYFLSLIKYIWLDNNLPALMLISSMLFMGVGLTIILGSNLTFFVYFFILSQLNNKKLISEKEKLSIIKV